MNEGLITDIPNFEGRYGITKNGKVWSYRRKQWNKIFKNKYGYMCLSLYDGSKGQTKTVHRLVMETYNPNKNKNLIIDHKNNDKEDNRLENLQWCTYSQNNQFAHDRGSRNNVNYQKGTDRYNAKLDFNKAKMIRKMFNEGSPISSISKYFNVSQSCIKNVLYRGDWCE
jgi:hypothetical protein